MIFNMSLCKDLMTAILHVGSKMLFLIHDSTVKKTAVGSSGNDLMFDETWQSCAALGADLVFFPSAWAGGSHLQVCDWALNRALQCGAITSTRFIFSLSVFCVHSISL